MSRSVPRFHNACFVEFPNCRDCASQYEDATYLEGLSEGEVGEEDVLLQHIADLPFPALAQSLPVQTNAARVQFHSSRQTIEQRCLPAACNPHHISVAQSAYTRHSRLTLASPIYPYSSLISGSPTHPQHPFEPT